MSAPVESAHGSRYEIIFCRPPQSEWRIAQFSWNINGKCVCSEFPADEFQVHWMFLLHYRGTLNWSSTPWMNNTYLESLTIYKIYLYHIYLFSHFGGWKLCCWLHLVYLFPPLWKTDSLFLSSVFMCLIREVWGKYHKPLYKRATKIYSNPPFRENDLFSLNLTFPVCHI